MTDDPLQGAQLVAALEQLWRAIRQRHPDVPDAVGIIGPGSDPRRRGLRLGHFADARWQPQDNTTDTAIAEVFFGGEGLARGPHDVLTTALHEAAHGLAATRRVKDTSRQGRYHNRRFKQLAEELGLTVTQDASLGWSPSTLAPGTADRYARELAELADALQLHRHREPGRTTAAKPTPPPCVCACQPPRKIRVAPGVLALGPILCSLCDSEFAPLEQPED